MTVKIFTDEELLEFNRLIQKMKAFCDGHNCYQCPLDDDCEYLYRPDFEALEVYLWAEMCRIRNGEENA